MSQVGVGHTTVVGERIKEGKGDCLCGNMTSRLKENLGFLDDRSTRVGTLIFVSRENLEVPVAVFVLGGSVVTTLPPDKSRTFVSEIRLRKGLTIGQTVRFTLPTPTVP